MSESSKRVPVVVDRLREAFRASSFGSYSQLAKAVGVSHAAISHIVNGKTEEPRRTLVSAIARKLGVTVEWLAGQTDTLPFASGPHTFDFGGRGRTIGPAASTQLSFRQALFNRFWLRCRRALLRDAARELGGREKVNEWFEAIGWQILAQLMQLLDGEAWRAILLTVPDNSRAPLPSDEDLQALTAGFERLLEPWFDDQFTLDMEAVRALVRMQQDAVWPMSLLFIPPKPGSAPGGDDA